MLILEIEGITSIELTTLLNNMRERWNSTRLYGRMFDPAFHTSPEDPMWMYVFTLWRTWTEGIRNLILIIEFDDSNQSCRIQIIGKNLKRYNKVLASEKLETEVAKFLTQYLS